MTQYHVDASEVASASSLAARSAEVIRTEVAAMLTHLHALEGSWQGGAAHAFTGLLQEWHATQLQVENALDEITLRLSSAADNYQTAEDAATRMFAR